MAWLPDTTLVVSFGDAPVNGYLRVQATLNGALVSGFASTEYLDPVPEATPVEPLPTSPTPSPFPEAHMPPKAGVVTKRTELAGARSLNEAGQPSRSGTTPEQLKASLAAIVGWLKPDDPTHKRYQPTSTATFCNIYAHDFCHLAGIYLPRVWWSQPALLKLKDGAHVDTIYGVTIDEVRANGLFRWLRDFGPGFGWRQTGTLTKLQVDVNQGAVGVIVARRTDEGRSGHIAVVVPETDNHRAIWDNTGNVTGPLQSQAGSKNFSYGTGNKEWWLGAHFAEHAFWIHA